MHKSTQSYDMVILSHFEWRVVILSAYGTQDEVHQYLVCVCNGRIHVDDIIQAKQQVWTYMIVLQFTVFPSVTIGLVS